MALMIGLLVNKILTKPTLNIEQLKEQGVFLFDRPRVIKPIELIKDDGLAFTNENLKNQWSLVFFGFTSCPHICPTTMAVLSSVLNSIEDKKIKNSTQVILVTTDPARDTAEILHTYVTSFNKDFIGVTGDFMKIQIFATNLNAVFQKVVEEGGNYSIDHSGYVFIVNPKGDYQGFIKPPFANGKTLENYLALRKFYNE
jgi:protein SCO1/2